MKNRILYLLFLLLTLSCSNHQSTKWDFKSFYKPAENPVLKADSTFTFIDPIKKESVKWQKADVFNPAAIVRNNKVYLLYRSDLATSEDGLHFTKYPTPVLYPDSSKFMQYDYPGGCEDPRIVQMEDSLYVLAYTSWNYKIARLSIAVSIDLIHWEKKGPAFAKANDGKFLGIWSKSGSIITKKVGDRMVAAKINGRYGMYWGENFVNLAWSDNLTDWYPTL